MRGMLFMSNRFVFICLLLVVIAIPIEIYFVARLPVRRHVSSSSAMYPIPTQVDRVVNPVIAVVGILDRISTDASGNQIAELTLSKVASSHPIHQAFILATPSDPYVRVASLPAPSGQLSARLIRLPQDSATLGSYLTKTVVLNLRVKPPLTATLLGPDNTPLSLLARTEQAYLGCDQQFASLLHSPAQLPVNCHPYAMQLNVYEKQ
ncbi:MAG: hypothetical protein ACRDHP_08960 [Ktedonobacterales bacterium]